MNFSCGLGIPQKRFNIEKKVKGIAIFGSFRDQAIT